jgi:hypothetical protein
MLDKLLGVRSFDGSIDHLACHQTTILTSLGRFSFLFVVQIVALTLLGCCALINLALITHF